MTSKFLCDSILKCAFEDEIQLWFFMVILGRLKRGGEGVKQSNQSSKLEFTETKRYQKIKFVFNFPPHDKSEGFVRKCCRKRQRW